MVVKGNVDGGGIGIRHNCARNRVHARFHFKGGGIAGCRNVIGAAGVGEQGAVCRLCQLNTAGGYSGAGAILHLIAAGIAADGRAAKHGVDAFSG